MRVLTTVPAAKPLPGPGFRVQGSGFGAGLQTLPQFWHRIATLQSGAALRLPPHSKTATHRRQRFGVRRQAVPRATPLFRCLAKVCAPALALALVALLTPLRAAGARNVFAGRESVLVHGVAGLTPGERVWFRVARGGRTLASGTAACETGGIISLPVALPEMKPGVVLPLEVALRLGSDRGRPLLPNDTLWAFAERPFAPGHNPAAPRRIVLYDPVERTAAALASLDVPFETVARIGELTDATNAVIVVGEGVALETERGLWEALTAAVARGNGVLLLAPADGALYPPDDWGRLTAGTAQAVLRHPLAGGPAYMLDLSSLPAGGAAGARFRLAGLRDEALFAVSADRGSEAVAWDDPASGGRFRACGLGLIARWEETPAARWLLAEILTDLGDAH